MGGFGWELRQQSQGGTAGGAIGGVGFGPLFAGSLKLKQGKILVTWIRGEPKNRCQFCAEPINPAGRVCPHCGREVVVLDVSSEPRPNVKAPVDGLPVAGRPPSLASRR
jgi:hypothetical protein